ncbi:titin homolog [Toxorhynchites rutilus septentrionalis]|uniref:titin homolog n=1 Tax=Toxorhynchites rutilus septentrionalis TaxID=329112 RepID=UPI0024784952|nr:titin homolog [Toxorhynchites rutilus septentrionalis]
MNQEEETPSTRVTRGALRRRSIDQDPASTPITPKKATVGKKVAVLDAIQEGSNGTAETSAEDVGASRSIRTKKDTTHALTNKSVQKLKDQEEKGGRRSRTISLTEENVAALEPSSAEVRRTPRRRASQDIPLTPQTALPTGRRMTRRNSVASDDGSVSALPATTPKASTSRLSVASTIAEDDEKELSSTKLDALSPDKSVRKLRGRSVSISPVPKSASSGKNTSIDGLKTSDGDASPHKQPNVSLESVRNSPRKSIKDVSSESAVLIEDESIDQSPNKNKNTSVTPRSVPKGSSAHKLSRNVTFDEQDSLDQQNQSAYPKTPIPASGEKRFKFNEKESEQEEKEKLAKSTPEMFDIDESADEAEAKAEQTTKSESSLTSKTAIPEVVQAESNQSESSGTQLDVSVDTFLVDIVENVRKSIDQEDMSMCVLDTPKPVEKQKSHFPHLRPDGGTCSTPIAKALSGTPVKEQLQKVGSPKFVSNTPDGRGKQKKADESKLSKSWSQAVKGKGTDKGIDVFSVRKQEQQRQDEEEAEKLNKEREEQAKKRKSGERSSRDESDEDNEEDEDEDDEIEAAQRNTFLDDEAMEVDDYQSGESMDSETRAEMEENDIPVDGESIGSQDSEHSDEDNCDDDGDDDDDGDEGEKDSFIVSDDEELEIIDDSDEEISETKVTNSDKKKRKRIIEQVDSSEGEGIEMTQNKSNSLNNTNATDVDDVSKLEINSSSDASKIESVADVTIPDKNTNIATPPKDIAVVSDQLESPAKTPKSPLKSPIKERKPSDSPVTTRTSAKSPKGEATPPKSPARLSPKRKENTDKPLLDNEPLEATVKSEINTTKSPIQAPSKVRKSLPAPSLLISADFYASSAKKAKRATINAMVSGEEEKSESVPPEEEKIHHAEQPKKTKQSKLVVTNPAALALAKKNKRLSLDAATAALSVVQTDKRMSLPGKFMGGEDAKTPSKKKKSKVEQSVDAEQKPVSNGLSEEISNKTADVEMMEVDEEHEPEDKKLEKASKTVGKKKPKDLSEFDHEVILSRCNEIVRADKERRQQSATLRQKKKDEKRMIREQEKQAETTEGDDSMEQQSKQKKKKKKKQINYLLEELGETKEEQLARALKRKMALLEAKRERKRLKKVAKRQQQLDKENQQAGGDAKQQGIGAKFEKKAKKKQKQAAEVAKIEAPSMPVLNVSAFSIYKEQIGELKQAEKHSKKKGKQLKEKNQQPSAVQEVAEALQSVPLVGTKSENIDRTTSAKMNNLPETQPDPIKPENQPKKTENEKRTKSEKKHAKAAAVAISVTQDHSEKKSSNEPAEKKAKAKKSKGVDLPDEPQSKLKKAEQPDNASVKPIVVSFDDECTKLKKTIAEPLEKKVVKKQKLSQKESMFITEPVVELTPPRKGPGLLKALRFLEEPVTPEQKLLKRNHGFKEEPVTPKAVGFKVSNLLPAGLEELQKQATLGEKKKARSKRNRMDDVKEPSKMLPLPIWTRSGTFEVEPVKSDHKKSSGDYIPLKVNGGGVGGSGGSGKHSTEFLLKTKGKQSTKAGRIDSTTVSGDVINFKKEAIFARNAHLREKKAKH